MASMVSTDELVVAKRKLDESLGDNFKIYLQTMRQWYSESLTKSEFDSRVHQFLTTDQVKAHNNFLLAVLNKCSQLVLFEDNLPQSISIVDKTDPKSEAKPETKPKPSVKPSAKKKLKAMTAKKVSFDFGFDRSPTVDHSYLRPIKVMDDCSKLSKVSYCQRESVLPDHFMSHLRVFVISWEMGLDSVQDNAVKLCNAALRDFIKTLLTEMFANRSSYRLRENRFKYCIGGPPINPYIKNSYPLLQRADHSSAFINPETGESQSQRPGVEEATNTAMQWMACGGQMPKKRVHMTSESINLRHLLYAMKCNRNLIPSYSVRCNAFYKTVSKLAELDSNSTND